jgi:hypothetical protein
MEEEMAIVKSRPLPAMGGLMEDIEGGVDHWSVHHGLEVAGGLACHGGAQGGGAALSWAQGRRRVSPPSGPVGPQGMHKPTG